MTSTVVDIETAFLHGDLDEEIYMDVPLGLSNRPNKKLLLRKTIHGLVQSARKFYEKLIDVLKVIGFDGKMMEPAGEFAGLYVKQARKAVVEKMQEKGLIEKIDENYNNRVGLCYKCKNVAFSLNRLCSFKSATVKSGVSIKILTLSFKS